MSQWCIYNDDGNSCKRLVDVVFRREPVSELEGNGVYSVINGLEAHKEKILICVNTNYNDMTFYENLRKKLNHTNIEQLMLQYLLLPLLTLNIKYILTTIFRKKSVYLYGMHFLM